jgi:hypothetical protein
MRIESLSSGRPCALGLLLLGLACLGCNHASSSSSATGEVTAPTGYDVAQDLELRDQLDRVVDACGERKMNTRDHAAWQIVHGILAYGGDLQIEHDGQVVSALSYLLNGGDLNGWRFREGERGLDSVLEAGSKTGQGHDDQWLGYLSQIGMPIDTPVIVRINGQPRDYTIHDLVTQAQWDIRDNTELTWTLMGLGIYLPIDAKWTASDGQEWDIERIIAYEAAQDMNASACGGSHRLYGIASALDRYKKERQPAELTGGWLTANELIEDSIDTIREYQQPDGSFSVKYFERPATSPDISLRLNTTGHTLEFLTLALSDEQLKEPWVVKAVKNLAEAFELTQDMSVECGGLYHSAHALELYRNRVFGDRWATEEGSPDGAESAEPPTPDESASPVVDTVPAPEEPSDEPPAPDAAVSADTQ